MKDKIIEIQEQVETLSLLGLKNANILIKDGRTVAEIVIELKTSPKNFVNLSIQEELLKESKNQTRVLYLSFLVLVGIFRYVLAG
jgi:hypothetical protein